MGQVVYIDSEAASTQPRVFVRSAVFEPLLSAALGNPSVLIDAAPFTHLFPYLVHTTSSPFSRQPRKMILVLSLRFSRAKAAAMLGITMTVALIASISASIALHSMEHGLGIFASVLGVTTILQGCMILRESRHF